MRNHILKKRKLRQKRSWRVRKNINGSELRPRLCVVKSNAHLQAQLIDDEKGMTICSTSTYSKEFRNTEFNKKNKKSAKKLGEYLANLAKEKNIKEVIFDRGPFKYHGVLAEFANSAREHGLQF